MDPRLLSACRANRLVVLVGAGCSLMPPTSLPSWNAINNAVLDALIERSRQGRGETDVVLDEETAAAAQKCVADQLARHDLPPEYFSEVCRKERGADSWEGGCTRGTKPTPPPPASS